MIMFKCLVFQKPQYSSFHSSPLHVQSLFPNFDPEINNESGKMLLCNLFQEKF